MAQKKKQATDRFGSEGGAFVPGLLIGWLAVVLWSPLRYRDLDPPSADRARRRHALGSDPGTWNARELRLLPGIGERRALAALWARERHMASPRSAEPLIWEDVRGIGDATAAQVRADLSRRGLKRLELWTPLPPEGIGGGSSRTYTWPPDGTPTPR